MVDVFSVDEATLQDASKWVGQMLEGATNILVPFASAGRDIVSTVRPYTHIESWE